MILDDANGSKAMSGGDFPSYMLQCQAPVMAAPSMTRMWRPTWKTKDAGPWSSAAWLDVGQPAQVAADTI